MLMLTALILLYVSQLIYVSSRWVTLTKDLVEQAQIARMRKSVDWTVSASGPSKATKSVLRHLLK